MTSSKDQTPEEQGEPSKWTQADEDVIHQVKTLQTKIHKLCRYQYQEQKLSAQVITSVLLEIASEVSGEWWSDEMEELFKTLDTEMEELLEEDDQEEDEEGEDL